MTHLTSVYGQVMGVLSLTEVETETETETETKTDKMGLKPIDIGHCISLGLGLCEI